MSDSQSQSQGKTYNIVVLISGNGSNLQALIDACANGTLCNARITHVISNRKSAHGLVRAATASPPIPTTYHNLLPYKSRHPDSLPTARSAYDADLAALILDLPDSQRPDLIVCAGWMHILSPAFLDPISEARGVNSGLLVRTVNLHPALPGEFAGANAIGRAWEAGRRGEISRTGVMVHEVVGEVDAGKCIVSREVELEDGETLEQLEERMHGVEHGLVVEGVRKVLGELEDGGKKGEGV